MKWFSNVYVSPDPLERAQQCVTYLSRLGDLPEREATARLLLETVREESLTADLYQKIVNLDVFKVNFYLAMFGSAEAIDALLKFSGLTQYLLNNILCNNNLQYRHLDKIRERIDDSPKGVRNKERLENLSKHMNV